MRKKSFVVLAIVVGLGLMTGCGKKEVPPQSDENASSTEQSSEAEGEEAVVEESHEGKYQSELTNEWIDESLKNQRPIAVTVDNEIIALPHYGLSKADIVYEITNSMENNGVTRLMVIVKDWGSIEQLGSIRSARPTNLMLAPEWNAVLCHDGGPFYIDEYLQNPYVNNFSGTFSRVKNGKPYEFTEYIIPGDLEKNFEESGYSVEYNQYYEGPHYQFSEVENGVDLLQNADAMTSLHIELPFKHNESTLDYNDEDGLYYYGEYGSEHIDPGNQDAQLSFKNIILQDTEYEVYDENGYMVFDVNASGRSGYYMTNGKAIPITWEKASDVKPTKYYDASGKEITLNTGKTYIAIIPNDSWDNLVIK